VVETQTEQAFQDLNLIFCELTSLLLLSPSASDKQPQRSSSFGLRRVAPYIVRLLNGTPTSRSGLSRPVSAQAYTALLPSIWALANAAISSSPAEEDDEEEDADVLQATLQHALRAPSTSAVKRASAEFVGRLLLLDSERQYHGPLRLAEASEWILHLPKTLWELGGRDPSTSEVIIRVLLRLGQRRARCLTSEVRGCRCVPSGVGLTQHFHQVSTGLLVRLVPFFMVTHATRGQLPGPYSKLPPALRRLMLDTVSKLQDMSEGDDTGATQAVVSATAGTEEAAYWANIRLAITV
jgi:pre-rRNA-processing protein IPI1